MYRQSTGEWLRDELPEDEPIVMYMVNHRMCGTSTRGWNNTGFLKGARCNLKDPAQAFILKKTAPNEYSIISQNQTLPESLNITPSRRYPIMRSCVGERVTAGAFRAGENVSDDWIKAQLQTNVVQVAVKAEDKYHFWYAYKPGTIIRAGMGCSAQVDHAVVIVGWKVHMGIECWIIRNSWGTDWGDGGYALLQIKKKENNGMGVCGINRYVYILDDTGVIS
jgi:hypothetical protein